MKFKKTEVAKPFWSLIRRRSSNGYKVELIEFNNRFEMDEYESHLYDRYKTRSEDYVVLKDSDLKGD